MSAGSPSPAAELPTPSLRAKAAAVAVVLALAALAAYTVFSGPTQVPAPAGASKVAPGGAGSAAEGEFPERSGDDGR